MSTELRKGLQIITNMIAPEARVLDVGCANGTLLAALVKEKNVEANGIEIKQEGVKQCIKKGLSVIQGDADNDLQYYPDKGFDYVIGCQVIQATHAPKEVLKEMLRISKNVIVEIPNFAHWRNRIYLATKGRMPVTSALSYEWYETPNIHFCTIKDFIILCEELGATIEESYYLTENGSVKSFKPGSAMANALGAQGIFRVKK